MDLGLTDRAVLITGGSKGLGLACARAFLREGARVAIVSRDPANLDAARADLAGEGFAVETIAANLSDPDAAADAVARAEAALGPVEVLVNSAGAARRTPPEELAPAAWKAAFDAKFFPYIYTQDAVLRSMRARAGADTGAPPEREIGAIVNIIGSGGRVPTDSHLPGGSANAALMLATIGLAKHHARYGIRINGINPSTTVTERMEQALAIDAARLGLTRDEVLTRNEAGAPMRRFGRAEEIADVALFLASRRASYVVGALVSVDGGQKAAF